MKALIWKELREHRMFAIAAVILVAIAETAFLAFKDASKDSLLYLHAACYIILPLMFSCLGAMPFSNEFAQDTKHFLLARPCGAWKIFASSAFRVDSAIDPL